MRRRKRLILVILLGLIAGVGARVWLSGPRSVTFAGHTKTVETVVASRDGRTLASYSRDGTIRLWDVASGKERATLRGPKGHVIPWSVVFSPDGKLLATTGDDTGEIRLWDVASGRELAVLTGHKLYVHRLAFSPDASTLASAGGDSTLRVWDVASHKGRVIQDASGVVSCMVFCCGGTTLATGGQPDGSIDFWDVASGENRTILRGHTSEVECMAASPDGRLLASGSIHGELKLWDATAGAEQFLQAPRQPDGADRFADLTFSPDGKTLGAVYWHYAMEFWDVASGKNTASRGGVFGPPPPGPPAALQPLLGIHPKLAEIYDSLTGEETGVPQTVLFTPGGAVYAVGRDDSDEMHVKMWRVYPVPRRE
jgi:WD40 repeat protein